MITKTDNEILDEISIHKGWTKSTYELNKIVLKSYTNFHGISFYELIAEAEQEEETIYRLKKRSIKQRLTQYQLYLIKQNKQQSTVNQYITTIKQLYYYFDIEVPKIQRLYVKNKENYDDLVTHEEITNAINNTKTRNKAIIILLASTGIRKSDLHKLTIHDFYDATKEYHNATNVNELIEQLKYKKQVVPTWKIIAQKNGINYITFSTPESVNFIVQYLYERLMKQDLHLDDPLFEISIQGITKMFELLNDKLGYGWKGTRRRFHAHSLRKFFGTTLSNDDVDFLSCEFMLGHTLSSVQSSYYFGNPEKLKNKYIRHMDKLTFVSTVNIIDVTSKEKRELTVLRENNKHYEEKIRNLEEMVNLIQSGLSL